ncbi:MAG: hypothetical protein EOM20_04275 [Spartobacteria bacterium]|nr:hypothetical protein [Spartobacteria bacterium]
MKAFLYIMAMVLLCAGAMAAVKIQGDFATDYVQVSNAVANAISGDTILIATGVYNEAVNIYGLDLTLDGGYIDDCSVKAVGGRSVIDADSPVLFGGWGSALDITGSVVVLQDMDLCGGEWSTLSTVGYGGGLDIRSGSIVTAINCQVYDNYAYGKGGGVYVKDSSLFLVDSTVFSNIAYEASGLMVTPYGWGGGVCVDSGLLDCDGMSDIWDNRAINEGGGICASDSQVYVHDEHADILGNISSNGGGVTMFGGFLRINAGADVAGNTAEGHGGGIFLRGGATGDISSATTSIGYDSIALGMNEVTNGMGGGICVMDALLIVSNRARVAFNSATTLGGGICVSNGIVILDNAYVGYGGQTNDAVFGGGIAAMDSTVTLISTSYLRGCRAFTGGGLYMERSQLTVGPDAIIGETSALLANQAWGGGGLYAKDSTLEVQGMIWNNMALLGAGGGLFVEDGHIDFTDAELVGNQAIGGGGGAYLSGCTGRLYNAQIISNMAMNGGGLYCAPTGTIMVRNSTFEFNMASNNGGALCVVTGFVEVRNVEMRHNTADAAGGGMYVTNGNLTVFADPVGAVIYDNEADVGGGIAVHRGFANLVGEGDFLLTGNTAHRDGGGLWIYQGSAFGAGRLYVGGNTAGYLGGGIHVEDNASLMMWPRAAGSGYIYNNRAGISGGGLCLSNDAQTILTGVRIGYTDPDNASPNYARGTNSFEGGGGVAVLGGSRLYATNLWVSHNISSNSGGGMYLNRSYFSVHSDLNAPIAGEMLPPNRFMNNRATKGNGGAIAGILSSFNIYEALICSNVAMRGGGVIVDNTATGTLVNVIIAENTASITGGGVRVYSGNSRAELLYCTLIGNRGDGLSGDPSAWVELVYSIAWSNTGVALTPGHVVTYCDVQGGYPGTGNINTNPAFKDGAANDYRLLYGSPCIDMATAGLLSLKDCINEIRPSGLWSDFGAYEYNRNTYDSDDDTIPDGWEADHGLNPLFAADALQNSDPDPYLNIEEYISDTDPFDGADYLYIASITGAIERQIGFPSSTNRLYTLYAAPRMTNHVQWSTVGTNVNFYGQGGVHNVADTNTPAGQAFYRVDVRLP